MTRTQIVGRSAHTRALRGRVEQVARFSSSVLITGPSGTGKELIARAIHEHSPRAAGPFVPVDCTALSGELFASHLFGHVKGAFTGANNDRLGCFRAAEGGTILLDEIGELSPELQSKLLRVLQERVVIPVGSETGLPVDVRVIAATNRNLADEVRRGAFRLDLFYRLNVVSLETLPLTARTDEIETLALHFLEKVAAEQGIDRKRFTPAALTALAAYCWPGNVRELQNVVERAVIFTHGAVIDAADIPFDSDLGAAVPAEAPVNVPVASTAAFSATYPTAASQVASCTAGDEPWSTLNDVERAHIVATLAHTFYNQSAAAALLHIDRASLARKIERYAIAIPTPRRGRPRRPS